MKVTYGIKIHAREDKKKVDGSLPLYYMVRFDMKVMKFPVGKYVLPQHWDKASSSVKKGQGNSTVFNGFLKKKIEEFEAYMLKQEKDNKQISLSIVRDYFAKKHEFSLFKFWEQQIEYWKATKEPNTLKTYQSTLNVLKQFNTDLDFADINYGLIEKYDHFLRTVRKNSVGALFNRHKCFKAIIRAAIKHSYLEKNPYDDFKIKSAQGNRKFLSIDEVKKLIELEIPEDEKWLHQAKDVFLFSCFTGIRFSDVQALTFDQVKTEPNRIEIVMKKTDEPLMIPLIPNAVEILNRNKKGSSKNQLVFGIIHNQVVNRNIKVLMERIGINKKISMHCSRHSFASNHVEAGTSILYLKDLLGHKSLMQTQLYAKALQKGLHDSMANLAAMY